MHATVLSFLLCLPVAAHAASALTPPAPEFPAGTVWLNSPPLTLKGLRDKKVVLLAFLNTTNINSLRALGALKALQARYGGKGGGLLIIGVHTPDYDFQKDPRFVRAALTRLGLEYPFALDGEKRLWKAYVVEGWPSFYLIDHKGLIVHEKLGEGGYADIEEQLREELDKLPRYMVPPAPELVSDPEKADCGTMTPELQFGKRRAQEAIPLTVEANRLVYRDGISEGMWGFSGDWAQEAEAMRLTKGNKARQSFLSALYRGLRAYALMGAAGKPVRVLLRQDDEWLRRAYAGPDVKFDDELHSYVDVSETKVYRLVKNSDDYQHEISLIPMTAGAAVYNLSFSDACLAPFSP